MKIVGIIPARLKSTRLPEKVLQKINGKPLLYYTYVNSLKSNLDEVLIATDSQKVKEEMEKYNIPAILTSSTHKSGTDRIGEVAKKIDTDFIINIQADEPLIKKEMLNSIISYLKENSNIEVITLARKIEDKNEIEDPNIVKVVMDNSNNALYFSRYSIPYNRDKIENVLYYKHIGVYGYRKDILLRIITLKESYLEKIEKLEQLRFLQNGIEIKVIITKFDTIGVDTSEDLERVRKIIEGRKW